MVAIWTSRNCLPGVKPSPAPRILAANGEMDVFEALNQKHRDGRGRRRWVLFVLGSVLVNAGWIAGAWFLIPREVAPGDWEQMPITFAPRAEAPVEEAAPPAPPPPPPPSMPAARLMAAGKGGARIRKALEAPAVIPDRPPSETDVVRPQGSDQWTGQGGPEERGGVAEASEAETQPLANPGADRRGPVAFNEAMDPPSPDPANPLPEYPEEARKAGVEGLVEVRIAISEDGAVSVIEVPRGQEPFVAAVLAKVPAWRFRPASLDGQPVAVQRLLRVPFRLSR